MSRIPTPTIVALSAILAAPAFADADMLNVKAELYDADYEAAIADHGYIVGAAVYGKYDADYEAYLTSPNSFATAALDAPYVATLKEQQVAGLTFPVPYGPKADAPIFLGHYDADYEPYVSTAATFASYDADNQYVADLKAQQVAGLTFPTPYGLDADAPIFLGHYDADYEPYVSTQDTFVSASLDFSAPSQPTTIELGQYDADYEVVLAEQGIAVGVALYGKYDADYEAYLTQQQTIRSAEIAFPRTTILASR